MYPHEITDLTQVDVDRALERGDVFTIAEWLTAAVEVMPVLVECQQESSDLAAEMMADNEELTDIKETVIEELEEMAEMEAIEATRQRLNRVLYVVRVDDKTRTIIKKLGYFLTVIGTTKPK